MKNKIVIFGLLLFIRCTPINKLSLQDTAFTFSQSLLQGDKKMVLFLMVPDTPNKKIFDHWAQWYNLQNNSTKETLYERSNSKFSIITTDVLQPDSIIILQIKYEIPNTPNNILKMVRYHNQWRVDWAYSETGNF